MFHQPSEGDSHLFLVLSLIYLHYAPLLDLLDFNYPDHLLFFFFFFNNVDGSLAFSYVAKFLFILLPHLEFNIHNTLNGS